MEQKIITAEGNYRALDEWLADRRAVFLVCDDSFRYLTELRGKLDSAGKSGIRIVSFGDFRPNPLYESVVRGVRLFRESGCDAVMAVGGGSAMDVAKCVKLYAEHPGNGEDGAWLNEMPAENGVPFLAMPTTAGTGSEATRYAVVYYSGAKQSVTSTGMIPGTVLMDPGALRTLPPYQRKATMCDALCHAVESFWSVNSTEESRAYSRSAIEGVLAHMDGYLAGTEAGNAGMLAAAHTAGKAINIAQTTAGHAMCYKITGLFGCAHGHAAILCDRALFSWMAGNTDRCVDPRGAEYLERTLDEIGRAMGCADARSGAERLNAIFAETGLDVPAASAEQYEILRASVNPVRLKNHPVAMDPETIGVLYHQILR